MNRRFLGFCFVLGVSALTGTVAAQQSTRVPVVGVLVTHAPLSDPVFENLRKGFRELGYENGRNIRIEIVTAEGHLERLPGLAQQLVRQNVDVIISPNELSTRTAQKATTKIPIVMIGWNYDPVALGLIDSFHRPGGNLTGLYWLPSELEGKRLEILKEALPRLARVAVLWDSFGRNALADVERSAQFVGVQLELIEVRGEQDLRAAFKAAKRKKVGAVMCLWSPVFYVHRDRVAALALDLKLPSISGLKQIVEAGGLMSYGADGYDSFRRAAYFVDRLLKGAKPNDLPVEQLGTFTLVVNLKTAKALGVALPQSILLRADEVIR